MYQLKDGWNACPRCGGGGCYGCDRKGFLVSCPGCAQTDLNFYDRDGDRFTCKICKVTFDKNGDIILVPEKPRPKPVVKKPVPKKPSKDLHNKVKINK